MTSVGHSLRQPPVVISVLRLLRRRAWARHPVHRKPPLHEPFSGRKRRCSQITRPGRRQPRPVRRRKRPHSGQSPKVRSVCANSKSMLLLILLVHLGQCMPTRQFPRRPVSRNCAFDRGAAQLRVAERRLMMRRGAMKFCARCDMGNRYEGLVDEMLRHPPAYLTPARS